MFADANPVYEDSANMVVADGSRLTNPICISVPVGREPAFAQLVHEIIPEG